MRCYEILGVCAEAVRYIYIFFFYLYDNLSFQFLLLKQSILTSSNKNETKLDADYLQKIFPYIKHNISSNVRHKRLYTLKILNLFDQSDVFNIAMHIEETETTISSYREKIIQLRRLGTLVSAKQIPGLYSEVIPLLCLGIVSFIFIIRILPFCFIKYAHIRHFHRSIYDKF